MEPVLYTILKHAHSGLRWIALLLMVVAIINAFTAANKREWKTGDKFLTLFAMVFVHIQLVIGIILYTQSPTAQLFLENMGSAMKDPLLRFVGLEHPIGMIIGFVLVTIGYSKSKRTVQNDPKKFRTIGLFYTLSLLVIVASIPWRTGGWV
jgi:heme A synthase